MMADKLVIEQHETLAEALLNAQSEYPPLDKGSKVDTGKFSYMYADLAYTKKVTDPHLWKHGLVIRDRTEYKDGKEFLVSELTHITSKESEKSEIEVTDTSDMKGLGGNITYARRYNYWNLTGRIGEDDSENRPTQRRQQERQQAPPENNQSKEVIETIKGYEKQLSDLGHKPMERRKEVFNTTALGGLRDDDLKKYAEKLAAFIIAVKKKREQADDQS